MDALAVPAADAGVQWDDAALGEAVAAAGGYPYFLQQFGAATWELAPGPDITVADARNGIRLGQAILDGGFFRARWDRATATERLYMQAMAAGGESSRTPDVAARMGRAQRNLGPIRAGLIGKGLIYAPEYGIVAFTVPAMADFISRQVDADHTGPALRPTRSGMILRWLPNAHPNAVPGCCSTGVAPPGSRCCSAIWAAPLGASGTTVPGRSPKASTATTRHRFRGGAARVRRGTRPARTRRRTAAAGRRGAEEREGRHRLGHRGRPRSRDDHPGHVHHAVAAQVRPRAGIPGDRPSGLVRTWTTPAARMIAGQQPLVDRLPRLRRVPAARPSAPRYGRKHALSHLHPHRWSRSSHRGRTRVA